MKHRLLSAGAGTLLAAGLMSGVYAQTTAPTGTGQPAHRPGGVAGQVLQVANDTLQIQTAAGSTVNVPYTAGTRVLEIKAGTTADLKPNTRVDLTLTPGTTTATAVNIALPVTRPAVTTKPTTGTKPTAGTKPAAGTWPAGPHPRHPRPGAGTTPVGGTTPPAGTRPARSHAAGIVASFSNGTLVLKGRGTATFSFTVAPNATISKTVVGSTADLHAQETVVVLGRAGAPAFEIIILKV